MQFINVVKGRITQALIATLLERSGYRVTRFGIEELFSEVKHLDRDAYLDLGLPTELRLLPDLLVADPDLQNAYLVEIKYRKRFDETTVRRLYSPLSDQRGAWPDFYTVLLRSDAGGNSLRFHQDYIRVLAPDDIELLNLDGDRLNERRWDEKRGIPANDDAELWHDQLSATNGNVDAALGLWWDHLKQLQMVFEDFDRSNGDMITRTLKDMSRLDD